MCRCEVVTTELLVLVDVVDEVDEVDEVDTDTVSTTAGAVLERRRA
jgi:hypothetical protein